MALDSKTNKFVEEKIEREREGGVVNDGYNCARIQSFSSFVICFVNMSGMKHRYTEH